jgi:hypothetical protein
MFPTNRYGYCHGAVKRINAEPDGKWCDSGIGAGCGWRHCCQLLDLFRVCGKVFVSHATKPLVL